MAKPFPRHEDRAADVEAERVVLERRAVTVAHQEADQALVRRVHLVLVAGERDACAVDDREVVGHRVVEPHEAVVEDVGSFARRLTSVVTVTAGRRYSGPRTYRIGMAIRIGTSGWSYPSWRPGFYPTGLQPAEFLRFYAERFDDRRAERDRVPAAERGSVQALG